jgi:hypothetical protein
MRRNRVEAVYGRVLGADQPFGTTHSRDRVSTVEA